MEKSRGKQFDRSLSFVGRSYPSDKGVKAAIAIVDPFSTGAHLANEVCKAGLICVRVLSVWDSPIAALVQKGLEVSFSATVQHNDQHENQDLSTDLVKLYEIY